MDDLLSKSFMSNAHWLPLEEYRIFELWFSLRPWSLLIDLYIITIFWLCYNMNILMLGHALAWQIGDKDSGIETRWKKCGQVTQESRVIDLFMSGVPTLRTVDFSAVELMERNVLRVFNCWLIRNTNFCGFLYLKPWHFSYADINCNFSYRIVGASSIIFLLWLSLMFIHVISIWPTLTLV